jgi:PAS domain S-box-containing protein
MIDTQILLTDSQRISSRPQDRGRLKLIADALRERPLARRRTDSSSRVVDLIEATTDFVFTADKKGNLLYGNRAVRQILGVGEDAEVSSIHLIDIYSARTRHRVLGEGIFIAILDGVWSGEAALIANDGREIPVSQVMVAPFATEGQCEYLSIIARDISGMKQAERVLRESERFYRQIVQAADIGIWIIDPENCVRFVNSKMKKLLGCQTDEIVGKPIVLFMDAEGIALAEAQRQALSHDIESSRDYKLCRKDGAELWVSIATSPLFDEHDQFQGTLALVTESSALSRSKVR